MRRVLIEAGDRQAVRQVVDDRDASLSRLDDRIGEVVVVARPGHVLIAAGNALMHTRLKHRLPAGLLRTVDSEEEVAHHLAGDLVMVQEGVFAVAGEDAEAVQRFDVLHEFKHLNQFGRAAAGPGERPQSISFCNSFSS
jgi:hypothetical protein